MSYFVEPELFVDVSNSLNVHWSLSRLTPEAFIQEILTRKAAKSVS